MTQPPAGPPARPVPPSALTFRNMIAAEYEQVLAGHDACGATNPDGSLTCARAKHPPTDAHVALVQWL